MVETRGLTHVAFQVEDADRAFRFYRSVLGAVEVYRSNNFVQAQTPGSWDVLVFEKSPGHPVGSGGIGHIGFRLVRPEDIDWAIESVIAAGGQILDRGEFCPGEPYVFFEDLDGYTIELWYELPTPVDPRTDQ